MKRVTLLLMLLGFFSAPGAIAQTAPSAAPFRPGETLEFNVGYGILPAGRMTIRVDGIEDFEGRDAYHVVFSAETNRAVSFVYEYDTVEESWFDANEFYSLRYTRTSTENEKQRTKEYVFDQLRQIRVEPNGDTEPTSPRAVDQLAMMYYLRLLPYRPGARFTLENLADPDDNPLKVEVIKKERVKVPAGTFETYVLKLDFRTDSGVFKKGGQNRIWLTEDDRHLPVKFTTKFGLGTFEAELVDYSPGPSLTSTR